MSLSTLRRARVAPMPGADNYADASTGFVTLFPTALDPQWGRKSYERVLLTDVQERYPSVLGEKESTLKFSLEAKGFGGVTPGAGSGVIASDGELGVVLKSVFGNQQKDTGSVCAAGTTATVIKVASTTSFTVGNFVGLVDPATGLTHVRQIRSKTATDLTLCRLLPFTPATSSTVYASNTFTRAADGHQHLWFDVEDYDATTAKNARKSLRGCLGSMAMKNTTVGGKLGFDFDFKVTDWQDTSGTTMGALAPIANLPAVPTFMRGARLFTGATQRTVLGVEFDLGNEIIALQSMAGANGISGFRITKAKQSLKWSMYWHDGADALEDLWMAETMNDLLIELPMGGPGNSFAFCAPQAKIIGVKPGNVGGVDTREFEVEIDISATTGVPTLAFGMI